MLLARAKKHPGRQTAGRGEVVATTSRPKRTLSGCLVFGAIRDRVQQDWSHAIDKMGEKAARDTIFPLAIAAVNRLAEHCPETRDALKAAAPYLQELCQDEVFKNTPQARELRMSVEDLRTKKCCAVEPSTAAFRRRD